MSEVAIPTIPCPKCGVPHAAGDGTAPCAACGVVISVDNFTPILAAASVEPGAGRCQLHPGKDAVDACDRCGGYVCDLCATRTGERLLCPSCFDWLHERDQLETTVARRMRWDHLTSTLFVLSWLCNVMLPFAMIAACLTIWKRRSERHLSPTLSYVLLALVFGMTVLLAIGVAMGLYS